MSTPPTIGIVDDDVSVLRALARLVSAWGHRVRIFISAQQFLDEPRDLVDEIGCLVLDVHMPGMSGLELRDELERTGRLLPIVFVTGAGDTKIRARASSDGVVNVLEKPFADADLRHAIELALTRWPSASRDPGAPDVERGVSQVLSSPVPPPISTLATEDSE